MRVIYLCIYLPCRYLTYSNGRIRMKFWISIDKYPTYLLLISIILSSISANNLHDVNCLTTEASSNDFRLKTNLYLVVDSAWQYEIIYPAVSYILDQIEVGKYGSSVTLLSSFDGSIIINKTFSPADFHSHYTLARHQSRKKPFFIK